MEKTWQGVKTRNVCFVLGAAKRQMKKQRLCLGEMARSAQARIHDKFGSFLGTEFFAHVNLGDSKAIVNHHVSLEKRGICI